MGVNLQQIPKNNRFISCPIVLPATPLCAHRYSCEWVSLSANVGLLGFLLLSSTPYTMQRIHPETRLSWDPPTDSRWTELIPNWRWSSGGVTKRGFVSGGWWPHEKQLETLPSPHSRSHPHPPSSSNYFLASVVWTVVWACEKLTWFRVWKNEIHGWGGDRKAQNHHQPQGREHTQRGKEKGKKDNNNSNGTWNKFIGLWSEEEH